MTETYIKYMRLTIYDKKDGIYFMSDVGPLFGHWISPLAIHELSHNSDGTVNIIVSEETAKRLTFKR